MVSVTTLHPRFMKLPTRVRLLLTSNNSQIVHHRESNLGPLTMKAITAAESQQNTQLMASGSNYPISPNDHSISIHLPLPLDFFSSLLTPSRSPSGDWLSHSSPRDPPHCAHPSLCPGRSENSRHNNVRNHCNMCIVFLVFLLYKCHSKPKKKE